MVHPPPPPLPFVSQRAIVKHATRLKLALHPDQRLRSKQTAQSSSLSFPDSSSPASVAESESGM